MLGPDAAILANRTLEDGSVEIVTVAESDLASINPAPIAPSEPPAVFASSTLA